MPLGDQFDEVDQFPVPPIQLYAVAPYAHGGMTPTTRSAASRAAALRKLHMDGLPSRNR
jgi:hypothetical protein